MGPEHPSGLTLDDYIRQPETPEEQAYWDEMEEDRYA